MDREFELEYKGIYYWVIASYKFVDNSYDDEFGTVPQIGVELESYKCYKGVEQNPVDILKRSGLDYTIRRKASRLCEDVYLDQLNEF